MAGQTENKGGKQRAAVNGLGPMGHDMAANIVGTGFPLTVTADRCREAVEAA